MSRYGLLEGVVLDLCGVGHVGNVCEERSVVAENATKLWGFLSLGSPYKKTQCLKLRL